MGYLVEIAAVFQTLAYQVSTRLKCFFDALY